MELFKSKASKRNSDYAPFLATGVVLVLSMLFFLGSKIQVFGIRGFYLVLVIVLLSGLIEWVYINIQYLHVIRLIAAGNKRILKIEKGKEKIEFESPFMVKLWWNYHFEKDKLLTGAVRSNYVLNMEIVDSKDKSVKLIEELPPWSSIPEGINYDVSIFEIPSEVYETRKVLKLHNLLKESKKWT